MATAQVSSNKCSMCKDRIGSLFCRDCEKLLCMQCRLFHDMIPSTKGHVVIDSHIEGRGVFKPKPVCNTHNTEFFSICKDCNCLICSECILSEHNGHTLGKIKETTDSSRKATEHIIEDLKSKGLLITKTLKEVKSKILPKLKSDSDKFSEMATSTSKGFQLIIDHVTTRSQTAASDFFQIEKESVLEYLASLECLRESYTKTYTKCENLLQEKHDVTFLFEKKLLQKDMDNLDEIPQLISPKSIDVFKQDDFVNSVIEEIQQKFTIG